MDLSQPASPLTFFLNFRFLVRTKAECRTILVRDHGEEGYNAVVASNSPHVFIRVARENVKGLVFVFIAI